MTIKEKVLIVVKAYPTLSSKYGELVCIGAMREDGSWLRIYPMPFRRFEDYKRFSKYTWIEIPLVKDTSDSRPESFRPLGWEYTILETLGCENNWARRKKIVLKKKVYDDISKLINDANSNKLSLATFKPAKINDFVWEEVDRKWDPRKIESTLMKLRQKSLFEIEGFVKDFKIIPKLPYRFSYKFEDINGKSSEMMIEDWETGQLFWSCLDSNESEQQALKKVKQKYLDEFVSKKDLYFFLGTTKLYHGWAKNPFLIVGTFHPPKEIQRRLAFPDYP
jgi:hypothetical protein